MTGGHVVAGSNPVTPNIKAASTKSEAAFLSLAKASQFIRISQIKHKTNSVYNLTKLILYLIIFLNINHNVS